MRDPPPYRNYHQDGQAGKPVCQSCPSPHPQRRASLGTMLTPDPKYKVLKMGKIVRQSCPKIGSKSPAHSAATTTTTTYYCLLVLRPPFPKHCQDLPGSSDQRRTTLTGTWWPPIRKRSGHCGEDSRPPSCEVLAQAARLESSIPKPLREVSSITKALGFAWLCTSEAPRAPNS